MCKERDWVLTVALGELGAETLVALIILALDHGPALGQRVLEVVVPSRFLFLLLHVLYLLLELLDLAVLSPVLPVLLARLCDAVEQVDPRRKCAGDCTDEHAYHEGCLVRSARDD